MNYLVDTHFLVWLSMQSARLTSHARSLLADPDNTIYFSAISILEIAIKQQLAKADFDVDAGVLRRALLEKGYIELALDGRQAAFVSTLPLIHRDPFDRLLVAQANVEGITLITADEQIALYPGPILKI
jgi:PIN domain nuclease of toxin-antitoxin system